jgi:hypothetical protein
VLGDPADEADAEGQKVSRTVRSVRLVTKRGPPGGEDVKGARVRSRRSPPIGRSGCQVARTVWRVVTDYASGCRRDERRDGVAGNARCAGKWRIEVNADVPERQGINLLVGPRGPWLQWVLRGRIT